ncbi:MAG: ribonuclease H family protein [Bacteroidales bacterium]|jgi:ribonuclease HI|nr:ribonuclease H family protein [Bacteroidales bacterium]MDY0253183.1 ribonuclease H family protein [Tenuifilaceae bacterium]
MAKKKYYVVWEGVNPGIYESWDECQKNIKGYQNAKYKSFPTRQAAEAALMGNYHDYTTKPTNVAMQLEGLQENQPKPIFPALAVDAAWNTATGDMEYQGVDAKTARIIFRQGPYFDGTNNVGEFLAIVHGLAYLKQKGSDLPIYTDSMTAISWVRRKKANTTLKKTGRNEILFELIARAEKWLHENTWQNKILKWETQIWGEIPADFGRK